MLLDGKVAVLSGVGPGLGRESAMVFAREGASVVLVARDERRIAAVAGEVERVGGRALAVAADLLAEDQCRAAAPRAAETFGRIDALVNLAFAESSWKSLLEVDADLVAWRRAFDVNVFGTLRMTRAVAVLMAERGAGSIVMVNSIASAGTMPRIADYTGFQGGASRDDPDPGPRSGTARHPGERDPPRHHVGPLQRAAVPGHGRRERDDAPGRA